MDMYPLAKLHPFLVTALCCAMALPSSYVWAADPATERGVAPYNKSIDIIDVALQEGSELHGRVVDRQGLPAPKSEVTIWRAGKTIAEVHTDDDGSFRTVLGRGGIYHVETADGAAILRVWRPKTAPPHAVSQVLVISGSNVVRGRWNPTQALLSHPHLVMTIAALMIAVPIILHNNRDDRQSSS